MGFDFTQIVKLPLLYLVSPAKDMEEAAEAARIVAFTAYGKVITGTSSGSMFTAHCMNRDFQLQTDDSEWEQTFKDRLRDDPPAVLVMPTKQITAMTKLQPDSGTVIAVFERDGMLIFEKFN